MTNTNTSIHTYLNKIGEYKDFTKFLIISKIKEYKAGFFLGNFWFLFETIIWITIYVFLIQIILRKNESNFIFYITPGVLSWIWFRRTVSSTTTIFKRNKEMIRNCYFPKYILILSENILQLINFIVTLIIATIVLNIFGKISTQYTLMIIPIIVIQFLFTLGITGIISNITVFFKDFEKIVNYALQILFYISPGLYSVHDVPEKLRTIFSLNPFTTIFSSYRDVLIFAQMPGLTRLTIILTISITIIIISIKLIAKFEGNYAKEI